jgi:hypothetical protein
MFMSKGPGRIERAISDIFAAEPDNAFTTEELCKRVYGIDRPEKKHRVPVLKAVSRLIAKSPSDKAAPWIDANTSSRLGGQLIVLNRYSIMSNVVAYVKGDFITNDRRVFKWSQDRIREYLERDDVRKWREPGGWIWWRVEQALAERDGDAERIAAATKYHEDQARDYSRALASL